MLRHIERNKVHVNDMANILVYYYYYYYYV